MHSTSRRQAYPWAWIVPTLIVLLSWTTFCWIAFMSYNRAGVTSTAAIFAVAEIVPIVLAAIALLTRSRWLPRLERRMEEHTRQIDGLSDERLWLWIALAAGVGLYLELVLIRYHSSCFAIFGFFKNLSLLSCFLGLGIGYALGGARLLATPFVLPILTVQLIALHVLRYADISVSFQNPVSEQLAMGLTTSNGIREALPVYAFLVWVFSLNALCLIPLGQLASRLMGRTSRLGGYGWNLLGSIAGIVVFWGLSFLWTPPVVWFVVGLAGLIVFLRWKVALPAVCGTLIVAVLSSSPAVDRYDVYSPYQILTVYPNDRTLRTVMVNHFTYQSIHDFRAKPHEQSEIDFKLYYGAPYQVRPNPPEVLVVGSGTGNDVAAALRGGAGSVDAVEIDPAVLQLGKDLHPEAPYASRKVNTYVQDARAFARSTSKQYDLIVYGLLDSHTALSGMSGVRLDSYVYTVEAFREARERLKADGVLCLSFAVINPELGRKLYFMLREAFEGKPPTVFMMTTGAIVFVISRDADWSAPLPPGAEIVTKRFAGGIREVHPSTDDWPFFYMPTRTYPKSYLVMIAMLMVVAIAFIASTVQPGGAWRDASGTCFLLGAGFMLLETKAITELALFYGSTWLVISIVIVAILIMAYAANLIVLRWRNIPRWLSYSLLLASLALSLWFSTQTATMRRDWDTRILATVMITLPMLFSGLVFSQEFAAARSTAAALGSNLIGAMLGGCLEYNSMYFGYRSLYVLAMIIYGASMLLSLVGRLRKKPVPEESLVASSA